MMEGPYPFSIQESTLVSKVFLIWKFGRYAQDLDPKSSIHYAVPHYEYVISANSLSLSSCS